MRETTKTIRINIDVFDRMYRKKKNYESWSAFFNRMFPEEKP